MKILITGAGGFIGGHLVNKIAENKDILVVATDLKKLNQWFQVSNNKNVENIDDLDLRIRSNCLSIMQDFHTVYNLACDHGGIGHIMNNKLESMKDVMINTNLIESAVNNNVKKFLFTSSACVYNTSLQSNINNFRALKEDDAYPAQPDSQYGWEKLFSEMLCTEYHNEYGIKIYLPRIHGCYGPNNHFDDGKEKAPNALIRKAIESKILNKNYIEIWGDGKQKRSFMFVEDCVEGLMKLVQTDYHKPLNLGNNSIVSIDYCVDIICKIIGTPLVKNYQVNETQGVRVRNSDNSRLYRILKWQPSISIEQGFIKLYDHLLPLVQQKIK